MKKVFISDVITISIVMLIIVSAFGWSFHQINSYNNNCTESVLEVKKLVDGKVVKATTNTSICNKDYYNQRYGEKW